MNEAIRTGGRKRDAAVRCWRRHLALSVELKHGPRVVLVTQRGHFNESD